MSATLTLVADGLAFPEGPVELADGSVALVQMAADLVTVVAPDGTRRDLACPGGPNGMALDVDGRSLLVCLNGGLGFTRTDGGGLLPGHATDRYARGGVARLDLASGALTEVVPTGPDSPLSGPNDIAASPAGSPAGAGHWITDLGRQLEHEQEPGCLAFLDPGGELVVATGPRPGRPNGLGLSPDGATLYVSESRAREVWAWPVLGPGVLGEPRLVHRFDAPARLDGLAVTAAGRVVVATLVTGHLTTLEPDGTMTASFPVDDPMPTNVCFAGPGRSDLLVTLGSTGRLVRVPWDEPGVRG